MNSIHITSVKDVLDVFKEKNLDSHSFCVVPFTNIILEPNGKIGVCRQKGNDYIIGDLNLNTLDEIWNNDHIQAWRLEHLQNNPSICRNEIDNNKCNLCPQNNKLLDFAHLNSIQAGPFLKLTANFNGHCNLKCKMCDVWKLPNGFYNNTNFWIPAKDRIFPYLKEVDMLSGEPFIQKDTYRLIDEISKVSPDCEWTITTNAHFKLNEYIIKQIDRIKFKNLIVSVDGITKNTYEKIRFPGRFEFLLANLERLKLYNIKRLESQKGGLNIKLNFLVQKDNWREVPDVFLFCKHFSFDPFITFCHEPLECSLQNYHEEEIINIMYFYLNVLTIDELFKIQRVIRPLLKLLSGINKAVILEMIDSKCKNILI